MPWESPSVRFRENLQMDIDEATLEHADARPSAQEVSEIMSDPGGPESQNPEAMKQGLQDLISAFVTEEAA